MRVADVAWSDYGERAASAVVVLPVGAVEPHARHLPLATDTLVATFMGEVLEREMDALLLPSIPYGCRTNPVSLGGVFAGSTWVRAHTLAAMVSDILVASYEAGARRFVVVNAHMANVPVVYEAIELFMDSSREAKVMSVAWWDLVSEITRDEIAAEVNVERRYDHHAAVVETSLVMSLAPQHVRTERIVESPTADVVPPLLVLPVSRSFTPDGIVYCATGASADIGRRVLDEVSRNLVKAVRREFVIDEE